MFGFVLMLVVLGLYAYFRHGADAGELLFMLGIFASAGYVAGYFDGHRKNNKSEDLARLILEDELENKEHAA